jgi:hypothetical protein
VLHNPTLGAEALAEQPSHRHTLLIEAFRDLTQLPFEEGVSEGVEYIGHVVLLGEAADEHIMNVALREVLRERFTSEVFSVEPSRKIDPLYAASRGVAEDCLSRLE